MTTVLALKHRTFNPQKIQVKSGLVINVLADEWQLLPTTAKGWKVDISWLWSVDVPEEDRSIILEVYTQYARSKAANTTATLIGTTKFFLHSGIPDLTGVRTRWSGLPTHHKKSLNQFFGTLAKMGYNEYRNYHDFTKANLDKEKPNVFDPKKGALNEEEYDSFCSSLNLRLNNVEWNAERTLAFFQSDNLFGTIRASVSSKLLAMIVRRPIQVSALKWSDLVPTGGHFNDDRIERCHEVGSIGNTQLQLRVFYAKQTGKENWRSSPERYPIALSVAMSETLIQYKRIFICGLRLLLEQSELTVSHQDLLDLTAHLPMFISTAFFALKITTTDELKALFNERSRAFHCNEGVIGRYLSDVKVESSRNRDCSVTSNRIRHTVLTRGSQRGLNASTLAGITGVTTPAARHYIDLDYDSRLLIDDLYLGSSFLADIFSLPLEHAPEDGECVNDQAFNPVGGLRDKHNCTSCLSIMGRPVGCYGCSNFRPILEADHRSVLEYAESKLAANSIKLASPEEKLSLEKLDKQIRRIKLTISACDQILESRNGLE